MLRALSHWLPLILILAVATHSLLAAGTASSSTVADLLLNAGEAEHAFRYAAAESLYVQAGELLAEDRSLALALLDTQLKLGKVLVEDCKFDHAEATYGEALLTAITAYGTENPGVAACLNGLGRIEFIRGHYGRSERLCRRALELAERTGGPDHPEIANSCRTLSFTCRAQNRITDGKHYARRAIAIGRGNLDLPPEDLALSYLALGFNERGQGLHHEARGSFLQAHAVALRAYGDNHPICALVYHHQTGLAVNLVRGPEGLLHADRALEIVERVLGPEHLQAGYIHWYRARALLYLGRFAEAIRGSERATTIIRHHLGPSHPDLAYTIGVTSHCYQLMGNLDSAMVRSWEATGIVIATYERNTLHLDYQSAALATQSAFESYSGYASLYFASRTPTQVQTTQLAETLIRCKGITSDLEDRRSAIQRVSEDPRVSELTQRLGVIRGKRSAIYFKDPRSIDRVTQAKMNELRSEESRVLAELAEFGVPQSGLITASNATVEQICRLIPEGACLIDYYHYRHVFPTLPSEPYREEGRLASVVLDRNGIRGHRDLGEWNSELHSASSYQQLLTTRSQSSDWTSSGRARFEVLSQRIYDRLWSRLDDLIEEGELVFVCPDISLNLISFGALSQADGKYLSESHAFHYLSSPRDLLRFDRDNSPGSGLFALADPDFDALPATRLASLYNSQDEWPQPDPEAFAVRSLRPSCEQLDSLQLSRLPNSRFEIEQVREVWESNHPEPTTEFIGASANEEAIKHALPGHRVVHIATHGYFISKECRGPSDAGGWQGLFRPLLYSGLLLAGANLAGRDSEAIGAEDGILTGDEVSSLDLTSVDLVVLSACETAVGEPFPGQGMSGVSRAFQQAGARQVVSALWPVSDAASIGAMAKIYGSPDKTVAEALQEFAIEQINADRAAGRRTDPFYWAPYISYGDWRAR